MIQSAPMSEFTKRQPLGEDARERAKSFLKNSRAINILSAFNSVIPGSQLKFSETIRIPYGDNLTPGYELAGKVIPSQLRLERQQSNNTNRLNLPPLERDMLTQSTLYVTTSKNNLVLAGTKTDTSIDPLKKKVVGGGIAFHEPVLFPINTAYGEILVEITKYLDRLDMISPEEQANAYELLKKQHTTRFKTS